MIITKKVCVFNLCIILFMLWFWYMELHKIKCSSSIDINSLVNSDILKTGDLILFKGTNPLCWYICNRYSHIGMVVKDKVFTDDKPYIFEAAPLKNMCIGSLDFDKKWNTNDKGILFTPLEDRLNRYNGYTFYKPLSKPLLYHMTINLINFILYALNNMEYNYNIFLSVLRKAVLQERCNNRTNCGEIIFLALIHCGLLDVSSWDSNILHHLKYVCNKTSLLYDYKYGTISNINKIPISFETPVICKN